MEEVIVSCVIKHLSLVDALQSLVNYQYREEHAEEYDLVCKIMAETFKKINAMQRQLQVSYWSTPVIRNRERISTHVCHDGGGDTQCRLRTNFLMMRKDVAALLGFIRLLPTFNV